MLVLLVLVLLLVAADGLVLVLVVVVVVVVVTPAALFSVSSIMWCFRFFVETFGVKNTVHTDVFALFPGTLPRASGGVFFGF